jgi:predicted AlkP superfamily phosphohydrolase/phosphomutase
VARRRARGLVAGLILGLVVGGSAVVWAKDLLPYRKPTVENTRQGATFWETAGEAGVRSTIVRVPATFPAAPYPGGHLLSGLGVPDIRGTFGTFTLYTTEALPEKVDENTEMGGKIIQVSLLDGATDTYVFGPRNRVFDEPPEILPPLHLQVNREGEVPSVTVRVGNEEQTMELHQWSDWVGIEFELSPLVKLYGIARFFFVSSEPFALYMSPINLDPHESPLSISQPPAWSGELADRFGDYKTLGWAVDTWALNELRIDEKTFLEDAYFTDGKYAEMMRGLLDEGDFRLYVQVYAATDRVAHVFWRLIDPSHPAYDPVLAAEYGNAIRDMYVFMDDVVGQALERLGPDDLLLICSDHGFHTWHKAVNYNTWLVRRGYMVLKNNSPDPEKKLEDLFGQGQFWPNVDWKRTKAYALGLGDIYLNVKGREAQGIVEPGEEYERIRDQLIRDLEAWTDPETGDHPVRRVYRREDVYRDFDPDLIPDLLAGNGPKYRVSWQTSLGGIPPELIQINDRKWSGDHCSFDAEITAGVFFSNRVLDAEGASIVDLCPTILEALGLPVPEGLDGKTLLP